MSTKALLTNADAALALEYLAYSADTELLLCLPSLSPATRLLTPDLTDLGLETWADLLAVLSRRELDLRILIGDCDPLLDPARHRDAWSAASGFADVLQGEAQLICAAHGQRSTGLRAWPLRRHLVPSMADLKVAEPARLTPVQRSLVKSGPVPRPADIAQSYALADGQRAVIGGPDLGTDAPSTVGLLVKDADFCGALHCAFADVWAAAINSGAPSLSVRSAPIAQPTRPQSRDDLRLLRTLSEPQNGVAPRTLANDIEVTLTRLLASARQHVLIRTAAFRHDGLAKTLLNVASVETLYVTLHLPPKPERTWDEAHATALQADVLRQLRAAYGDRLKIYADPGAAKGATLCLVDDVTVLGSAPLTRRACRWNSETMVLARDGGLTQAVLSHLQTASRTAFALSDAKPGQTLWPRNLF